MEGIDARAGKFNDDRPVKSLVMDSSPLKRLREALDIHRSSLVPYEKPAEPLAYEIVRALDHLFCRGLMEQDRSGDDGKDLFRTLCTWGINHALRRIIPKSPARRVFQDFPSRPDYQAQADDFVFSCGVLALAERLEGWLRDGILSGEVRPLPELGIEGMRDILVLRSATPSLWDEEISMAGSLWASGIQMLNDSSLERSLEERHRKLQPYLERRAELVDGWRVMYTSNRELDDYFMEWARLYLRRIFARDLIGLDEKIGCRPFSRYLEVLTVLSGRAQKHLAFASILWARHPFADLRNLLTMYYDLDSFVESVARYLDGDRAEIGTILRSLILAGDNLEAHTAGSAPTWAPLVQASAETLILPVYGLDINPFLFLLNDLRHRYKADWFRVANNREQRWIEEMTHLFDGPRWQTHGTLRLREGGKEITDIDFAAFEQQSNQLALFQLKWQQPVGLDDRGRRSSGKNLTTEGNRWIVAVGGWLERHGVEELMRRFGFGTSRVPSLTLFVLGRYHVHLSGFDNHDPGAIWSDWAHFRRALAEGPESATVAEIAYMLQGKISESRANKRGESTMFPVGDLSVILNPTSVPSDISESTDGTLV